MNETESHDQHDVPTAAAETATDSPEQSAPAERASVGVDLANRPAPEWLDSVESELDDTDLVLKCLARDSAKICQTCDAAQSVGELEGRPMLARCASTKQPR